MLLPRRQPDKPAAATNKLCSIRTRNGVYTEFGIDPDDRLARQLFQSAYVGSPQEDILLSCSQLSERELRQKLLDLLACNPFPHDEIELGPYDA